MKNLNKDDLLGYLQVLGYQPVISRLSFEEQRAGIRTLTGCYVRIMDALEVIEYQYKYYGSADFAYQREIDLKKTIDLREHFNAKLMLTNDDPILINATAMCAEFIFSYI